MRIFIAGATGVLGRRLVRGLSGRGHEVVGLARTEEKAAVVRDLGGRPARADLFDAEALTRVADGAEVVIHAATAIPTGANARSRKAWDANDRIRREGTRALASAADRVGARRYVQQSVAWVVRARPEDPFYDEDTPPDPPRLLRSAVEGEEIALEAGARGGFEVAVLRGGSFYGPDAAHSRNIAGLLLRRRMPILGKGDFRVALVHVDDAARAFALVATAPEAAGIWHVVDDEPVTFAAMLRTLAGLLGAPPPRRVPLWLARLVLGRDAVESLTTSMNTTNTKLTAALGWSPRFPTYREGLADAVRSWRREGFLDDGGPEARVQAGSAEVTRTSEAG